MVWKFFAKDGCQSQEFKLKVLCIFAMGMVILALSSLKVCLLISLSK